MPCAPPLLQVRSLRNWASSHLSRFCISPRTISVVSIFFEMANSWPSGLLLYHGRHDRTGILYCCTSLVFLRTNSVSMRGDKGRVWSYQHLSNLQSHATNYRSHTLKYCSASSAESWVFGLSEVSLNLMSFFSSNGIESWDSLELSCLPLFSIPYLGACV